jgi:hypothetical protein
VLVAGLAGCATEASRWPFILQKHGHRLEQRVGGQVGTEFEGPQQHRCTRSDVTVAASQLLEVAAVGRPHQPLVVLDGGREPLSGHLSPDPVPHLLGGDSLTLYASDGVHDPAAVRLPVGASTCSASMACLAG